ncbi:MAG: general stress protein CsbD, partial [Chitinophagaceae bacterium]|nr:general stress protein CsbD [Polaromonas sp.]
QHDVLVGRIQARHGVTKDEAHNQVETWKKTNPTNFFERY